MPGVILAYKYSQFRQKRREAQSRRVTERELNALHNKIVSCLVFFFLGIWGGLVKFLFEKDDNLWIKQI